MYHMIQAYTFVNKFWIYNLFFYLNNYILTELTFMLITVIYSMGMSQLYLSALKEISSSRKAILELDSLSAQVKPSQILPLIIIYN